MKKLWTKILAGALVATLAILAVVNNRIVSHQEDEIRLLRTELALSFVRIDSLVKVGDVDRVGDEGRGVLVPLIKKLESVLGKCAESDSAWVMMETTSRWYLEQELKSLQSEGYTIIIVTPKPKKN